MGGFFNTVLGTGGLGLTGTETGGTQNISLDPTTQAINNLRYGQMNDLAGQVGGAGDIFNRQWQYSSVADPTTQAQLGQLGAEAFIPGVNTSNWYNGTTGIKASAPS